MGKYFPIYETRVEFNTISLYCNIDTKALEDSFESLRIEMKKDNYIPILKYKGGEYIVHVVRQPDMKFRSNYVNLVMLAATIVTTILAGSLLWIWLIPENAAEYSSYMDIFLLDNLANGALYFALPLMLILGVHEMAHYYAAKRHGIAASLPFFIPVPPIFIPPLGTMGAFISIREPIPNKKALLDIGISGPIAGFLMAIPITAIGLHLSSSLTMPVSDAVSGGTMMIGESIFFQAVRSMLALPENISLHPLAFAGWVGIFVTALNLLPAGQLDGGHVARALLGDKARFASYAAFGLMLILGLWFNGWIVFAMLIMLLGLRHPPPLNDVTKLDNKRKVLGAATALILVLCFVPIPFSVEPVDYNVEFHLVGLDGQNATDSHTITMYTSPTQWSNETQNIRLESNGNIEANITVTVSSTNESLANATMWLEGDNSTASAEHNLIMEHQDIVNMTLHMAIPPNANGTVIVRVFAQENSPGLEKELEKELTISLELRKP